MWFIFRTKYLANNWNTMFGFLLFFFYELQLYIELFVPPITLQTLLYVAKK